MPDRDPDTAPVPDSASDADAWLVGVLTASSTVPLSEVRHTLESKISRAGEVAAEAEVRADWLGVARRLVEEHWEDTSTTFVTEWRDTEALRYISGLTVELFEDKTGHERPGPSPSGHPHAFLVRLPGDATSNGLRLPTLREALKHELAAFSAWPDAGAPDTLPDAKADVLALISRLHEGELRFAVQAREDGRPAAARLDALESYLLDPRRLDRQLGAVLSASHASAGASFEAVSRVHRQGLLRLSHDFVLAAVGALLHSGKATSTADAFSRLAAEVSGDVPSEDTEWNQGTSPLAYGSPKAVDNALIKRRVTARALRESGVAALIEGATDHTQAGVGALRDLAYL